jgi:hypothetical protein
VTLAPRHQADGIERELPIRIGVVEAAAISTGVDGTQERPKTHDLLLTTIRRLGATLTGVAIVDVRGTTFYANLLLEDTQAYRSLLTVVPLTRLRLPSVQEFPSLQKIMSLNARMRISLP